MLNQSDIDATDDVTTQDLSSDVQSVVYSYILIPTCLFGILANLLNLRIYWRLGLSDVINASLLSLSMSDLCSLLPLVWLSVCAHPEVASADLWFDANKLRYLTGGWPHVLFTRVTCWNTAFISLERCLCVTLPLKVKILLPRSRSIVILVVIYIVSAAGVAPVYFVNRLSWEFDSVKNRTVLTMTHTEDRDVVERVAFTFNNLSAWTSFVIVIISTLLTVRQVRKSLTWRRDHVTGGSDQPATSESSNNRLVKMVLVISVLFIALMTPMTLNLTVNTFLPDYSITGRHKGLFVDVSCFIFLAESVNSSVNIFVYLVMSSRFRQEFCRMFHCRLASHDNDGERSSSSSHNHLTSISSLDH